MPPSPLHTSQFSTFIHTESGAGLNNEMGAQSGNVYSSMKVLNIIQTGFSASHDKTPIKRAPSSVSIGSPRSVFVPVSPSHSFIDRNSFDSGIIDAKFGGVAAKWKAMENQNQQMAAMKSRPLEYRFKPIIEEAKDAYVHPQKDPYPKDPYPKDPYPEVKKSILSSRARQREHVPFSHVYIRDDESTVSGMSYDQSEIDVDALYSKMNLDANTKLIKETDELIKRITRHNIGVNNASDEINKAKSFVKEELIEELLIDKENMRKESNDLLNQLEATPLSFDLDALNWEDQEQAHDLPLEVEQQQPQPIHEGHDHDLSFHIERRQRLPSPSSPAEQRSAPSLQHQPLQPDIEALIDDIGISFDDLRDDVDEDERRVEEGKKS